MKVKALVEALEKILKSYKKEIESSSNINIIVSVYYDDDSERTRRQIIIDYVIPPLEYKQKERSKEQNIYYM
jgi:hypothetical protein